MSLTCHYDSEILAPNVRWHPYSRHVIMGSLSVRRIRRHRPIPHPAVAHHHQPPGPTAPAPRHSGVTVGSRRTHVRRSDGYRRAEVDSGIRFILPNIAGPARLVPLAAWSTNASPSLPYAKQLNVVGRKHSKALKASGSAVAMRAMSTPEPGTLDSVDSWGGNEWSMASSHKRPACVFLLDDVAQAAG